MRELVYYVAVTLDGFIAGPNGEFDAFPTEGDHADAINERFADTIPTDLAAALGLRQDGARFDTVLMGWNTYAVGLPMGATSPYRHLRQFVFTGSNEAAGENLEVTSEDPVEVVRRLKAEPGASIWLCGGGALAATLAGEIDRLVLKRYPLLFGAGIPLFGARPYAPEHFEEVSTTAFESGVVFSEYVRRPAGV
jgi:dihydrofolate reductase